MLTFMRVALRQTKKKHMYVKYPICFKKGVHTLFSGVLIRVH